MKIVRIGFLSEYYWGVHCRDIMINMAERIPSFRFMRIKFIYGSNLF
jgi:hypothetical protein